MALLVFTIIEAPDCGWAAGRSVAGFAASAVLLAAFIVRERRAAHPMLDVRLFRNLRFSAASGAVTVSFFTLFGFIFLMTQYFQFVRGYGPLSTGVRLLPVALSVGAGSVAGTQLAVRAGTKLVVTTGLVAMAAFYGWVAATTSTTTGYGVIAVQMVLYGLGLGLTSAPATESIMGAISRAKAGVGSAVNDSTRLVGGSLGVAVIGSIYASVYGSRLSATMPAGVPGRMAAIAHQSVGAAYLAASKVAALGHPVLGQALQHASANAFLRGLTIGCIVAGGVAAVGALLAVLFLPAQPAQPVRAVQPARPVGSAAGEVETARAHIEGITAMTGPITRHRDIESLKTAARWPGADRNTTVTLATRLAAARADAEGYRYFAELAGARQARRCRSRSPGSSKHGWARTRTPRWPSWTRPRPPILARRSTSAGWRWPGCRRTGNGPLAPWPTWSSSWPSGISSRPCCCAPRTTAWPPPTPCWATTSRPPRRCASRGSARPRQTRS